MKRLKFLLVPLMTMLLSACSFAALIDDFFDKETFSISDTSLVLVEENSAKVSVKAPSEASVSWSISNATVASIDTTSGLSVNVTALKQGNAVLTATAKVNTSESSLSCSITVYEKSDVARVTSTYSYKDYADGTTYMSVCPSKGNSKLLIVPVWFTDSDTYIATSKKDTVKSDIEKTYLGSTSETGWESVRTYYEKDSFGAAHLDGFITDWYSCGKASTYYYKSEDRTMSLVDSAVNWYKSTYSVSNMKDFDKNGDGWVDGVMLIYAAPDYRAMNKESSEAGNMWAYCYWLSKGNLSPSTANPVANVFFWASYDFMYSSAKALIQTGKSNYGTGDTSYCRLDAHTYIHEMGHVFGLEDYYNYDNGSESTPAGSFSMQDFNIGAHDPYSRLALGWVTPYVPSNTCTFTVGTTESNGDIVVLSPNYTGSPFDEYIILELYTPSGLNEFDTRHSYGNRYPTGPTRAGVRIWHVDARLVVMEASGNTWKKKNLTTNPRVALGNYNQYCIHATTNSTGTERGKSYAGSYDYNLLELIRNDTSASYNSTKDISNSDLFYQGDTFTMNKYAKQFVNSARLNSMESLGWEVRFDSVSSSGMTITCTKK